MKIIMVLFHICMTVAKTNGICYKCKTGWKISGTMYSNEVIEAAQPVFYNMLIVMFISLVIGGALIYFVTLSITKPLKRLVVTSKEISEGDLTQTIEIHSNDEIGQLAKGFNEMTDALRTLIGRINTSAGHVAAASEEPNGKCKTSE